jgi:excisionase family DNA binding protein
MTAHLLNFEEAARTLGVRESWLRDKVAKRQVPHTRLGKHVRFSPDDLAVIVRSGHQPAVKTRPAKRSS